MGLDSLVAYYYSNLEYPLFLFFFSLFLFLSGSTL